MADPQTWNAAEIEAALRDLQFLDMVRQHWGAQLLGMGLPADDAAALLEDIETFLLGLRSEYRVSADDVWRALLRGCADAATLAALSGAAGPGTADA